MTSDNFSEFLGYILFVIGLAIVWWKFDWVTALAVGFLLYSMILMMGGYFLVLVKQINKRLDDMS